MTRNIMNQLGIAGEPRDECLMLKYRRCLRNIAKWATVLDSVVAGRGSGKKQPEQQVVYQWSYKYFSVSASAKQTIFLLWVSHKCCFLPFDKNSPDLAMSNKWQLLEELTAVWSLYVVCMAWLRPQKNPNQTAITYNIRKWNLCKSQSFTALSQNHSIS